MATKPVEDWVLKPEISSVTQGARLQKVWELYLLRRTNISIVPFNVGIPVGATSQDPQRTVSCAFSMVPEL